MDWRAVRMTGSEAVEAASLDERRVSMRLMKRVSGRRVTEELSLSLARRRLGQ